MITPAYTEQEQCSRPPSPCEIEGPYIAPLYGFPYIVE
jgi:hypothetical protein